MAADTPSFVQNEAKPRLDVPGLILITPSVAAIILGLTNAGRSAGFGQADVIIPLLAGAALYGTMLLLPLYYQQVRGVSALTAGVMLVPQGIGMLLSRSAAGRLTDKIGARTVAAAGFAIVALTTIPFAFAGAYTNAWLLALWLVARGFGLGAVTIPVMAVAYLGLDRQQIAHSSVLTRTTQQIGGSFGTAVLAVILEAAVSAHPGDLPAAFGVAFWWSVAFSLLAVLLSLWLPGAQRDDDGPPCAAASPEPAARSLLREPPEPGKIGS